MNKYPEWDQEAENEYYRELSAEKKLKIAFWFFRFKRKLEKAENPKVMVCTDPEGIICE